MHKMFKHLKPYAWMLAVIVALLVVQAMSELTLPTYTAAIVDVGIQQQGIQHSAPDAVRASVLNSLAPWMEGAEAYYEPADAETLSRLGVTLQDEEVMVRQEVDEEVLSELDEQFDRAWTLEAMVEGSGDLDLSSNFGQDLDISLSAGEAAALLASLSASQRSAVLKAVDEALDAHLPQGTLRQAAISAVCGEYEALGMDLRAIQNAAIWQNGLKMLLIALLGTAAAVAVGFFGSLTAAGLGRDLRRKVFHQVIRFSQQEMDRFSTASLITRSTNDIQQVQNVTVMLLRMVIYAPIIGIGGVIKALNANSSMAWVIALGVALVMAIVLVMYLLGMPRFKRMQKQIDDVNRVMRETLTGLPVIRAFCTQSREEERFDAASMALKKTQLFVGRLMGGMMPLMMLTMNGISVLIMWVGAGSIDAGAMQVGDMLAFIQYTMQIIMAFLMISLMSVMLPRASVSAGRIQEVLDTPESIASPASPKPFDDSLRGTVTFQDVRFRYPGSEEDTLSHISFTALPGQTTAILGGTGCGKSTLINLIPRFYDVTEGQVLVDGCDVRQADLNALRDRIGYVPQKGVLFSGTVESNIGFGSKDIAPERVREAAQIAQAEGFILQREDGYQSDIAQGGANVSGGQKQRLSIARAVAKSPEIYLFDDSFSALDFKTDAQVRSALAQTQRDATVIVVAQRISTVMHAQQILVLDEGRLVGKGTHAELMRDCEIYRQIAMSQLSKEELERGTQA